GGAGDDTFNFGAGGSLSGQIDGGAGTSDAVDYTALGAITVTLGTGVTNIEDLLGATAATLAGGSTWVVTGANTGTADGFNFSGFGNIAGTAANDTFTINDGGSVTGSIDGLGGTGDCIDVSAITAAQTLDVGGSSLTSVASFANVVNVTGDGTNDIITNATAYTVTGVNDGTR